MDPFEVVEFTVVRDDDVLLEVELVLGKVLVERWDPFVAR